MRYMLSVHNYQAFLRPHILLCIESGAFCGAFVCVSTREQGWKKDTHILGCIKILSGQSCHTHTLSQGAEEENTYRGGGGC